jgi:hypothetical protein
MRSNTSADGLQLPLTQTVEAVEKVDLAQILRVGRKHDLSRCSMHADVILGAKDSRESSLSGSEGFYTDSLGIEIYMKNMQDEIYDVFWEGPYEWGNRKVTPKRNHVLYSILGAHYIYGPKTLLYIGRTGRAGGKRLDEHDSWVDDESEEVFFKLASIGKFKSWEIRGKKPKYSPPRPEIVKRIESLLIYAHQPAYNSQDKQELARFHNTRVFNSGRSAPLLPEVSYRCFMDEREGSGTL